MILYIKTKRRVRRMKPVFQTQISVSMAVTPKNTKIMVSEPFASTFMTWRTVVTDFSSMLAFTYFWQHIPQKVILWHRKAFFSMSWTNCFEKLCIEPKFQQCWCCITLHILYTCCIDQETLTKVLQRGRAFLLSGKPGSPPQRQSRLQWSECVWCTWSAGTVVWQTKCQETSLQMPPQQMKL